MRPDEEAAGPGAPYALTADPREGELPDWARRRFATYRIALGQMDALLRENARLGEILQGRFGVAGQGAQATVFLDGETQQSVPIGETTEVIFGDRISVAWDPGSATVGIEAAEPLVVVFPVTVRDCAAGLRLGTQDNGRLPTGDAGPWA